MPDLDNIKKHRGGALLTALFIMTLVAIVATAMSTRLQLDIYRTRLLINYDRLYLASQAIMFWSFNELNNKKNTFVVLDKHNRVSTYPSKMAHIYQDITLSGGLYDLQSKININNLSDKKETVLFLNLLRQIDPKANEKEKNNLVSAIRDWLSAYDLSKGNDLYNAYYTAQKPPYFPSHQLIKSTSELRLIKGIDARQDQLIQPFITALPEVTPININTASKDIIASLGDGLNESQVKELLIARDTNGISSKKLPLILQKLNISSKQVTVESKYFLSEAIVKTEDLKLRVYILLKRDKNSKGIIKVSVLRESLNVF